MNANDLESVNAGSSTETKVDPSNGVVNKEEMVPKTMYAELEKKLGEQGSELGELREDNKKFNEWLDETRPIWEKLEENKDLTKAILENKIDSTLVQAILGGKVSIKEAEQVTEAHKEVKEDLGKEYKTMSPEDISKLVETKLKDITSGVQENVKKTLAEERAMNDFENKVKEFIRNTKDYEEYVIDVNKYLELHPNLDDIEIAYHAVKGQKLAEEKEKAAEKEKAENSKNFALNASSGGSQSSGVITNSDDIEKIVSLRKNPNNF